MNLLTLSLLILCTASVAAAALACLYHLGLMAVAPFCRGKGPSHDVAPSHSFAIVIPAHDEETIIKRTLDSCAAIDYPKEKFTVYVIADNCTDRTAEVAQQGGAHCLVRRDDLNRGKGFALEWALPQVLAAGHDAVVVLDADCLIDSHSLLTFDEHMRKGARVLQASDVVANPDANATSYVLAVANMLENAVFFAPKSALRLAVFLRGTGMAFHRDVLLSFPWRAQSIVEDLEYSLQLLKEGVRIWFVPRVRVLSDFPVERDQLAVQRARWIGGGVRVAASWAPRLAWEGLQRRRWVLLDAVLTMLVTSRPLIIAQLLFTVLLSLLCWWISPGLWSTVLLAGCLAVVAGYMIYTAAGVALLGVSTRRVRFLLRVPIAVADYLLVAMKSSLARGTVGWNRTPRFEPRDSKSTGTIRPVVPQ